MITIFNDKPCFSYGTEDSRPELIHPMKGIHQIQIYPENNLKEFKGIAFQDEFTWFVKSDDTPAIERSINNLILGEGFENVTFNCDFLRKPSMIIKKITFPSTLKSFTTLKSECWDRKQLENPVIELDFSACGNLTEFIRNDSDKFPNLRILNLRRVGEVGQACKQVNFHSFSVVDLKKLRFLCFPYSSMLCSDAVTDIGWSTPVGADFIFYYPKFSQECISNCLINNFIIRHDADIADIRGSRHITKSIIKRLILPSKYVEKILSQSINLDFADTKVDEVVIATTATTPVPSDYQNLLKKLQIRMHPPINIIDESIDDIITKLKEENME